MKQYLELCNTVLKQGTIKADRTKTGTISYFGTMSRYDLNQGFPLLTTKKVYLKAIIHELLWFIQGNTNIKYLVDHDVRIWNEWPYQKYTQSPQYQNETLDQFINKIKTDPEFALLHGDLGPVYGRQWRYYDSGNKKIDQLAQIISELKTNPDSRRLIINAWNPGAIDQMLLPPCHLLVQFYVVDQKLSCQLYQRSADLFLGVPFNIASYALLTMMIAQVCDLQLGEFIHTIGDCHIYLNHLDQIKKQIKRTPRNSPKMIINPKVKDIDQFQYTDFELVDYHPYQAIKGKVAV